MTLRRLFNIHDDLRGVVTYELPNGRRVVLDAAAVREYGAAECLRRMYPGEYTPPEGRLPVIQDGFPVGTLPAAFDPERVRSRSILYDPRPGDFRLEGGVVWVAASSLGPSDLRAVVGFKALGER